MVRGSACSDDKVVDSDDFVFLSDKTSKAGKTLFVDSSAEVHAASKCLRLLHDFLNKERVIALLRLLIDLVIRAGVNSIR